MGSTSAPGHLDEVINSAPHIDFPEFIANASWGDRPVTG
jgi:hypothetical protein